MTVKSDQTVAYRMTAEEVVAELGSDPRHGLSGQDASARLRQYGPNELETEKPEPAWRRFLAQFQDVLIILLLAPGAATRRREQVASFPALLYSTITSQALGNALRRQALR